MGLDKQLSDINAEKVDKPSENNLCIIYPNDLDEILKELNSELPPVPAKPKTEQENPPPYIYPRETIGSKAPKASGGKDSKKEGGKAKKSKSPKKDKKGGKKGKKGGKNEDVAEGSKPKIAMNFHIPAPRPSSISDLIEKDVKEIYSYKVHLNLLEDQ